MALTTSKMLVAFDTNKQKAKSKTFIIPNIWGNKMNFKEIDNSKEWQYGTVVFVGQKLQVADIFKRIVDSGIKIESVNELKENIELFIEKMNSLKIDDIVEIRNDDSEALFSFIKRNEMKKKRRSNIP